MKLFARRGTAFASIATHLQTLAYQQGLLPAVIGGGAYALPLALPTTTAGTAASENLPPQLAQEEQIRLLTQEALTKVQAMSQQLQRLRTP